MNKLPLKARALVLNMLCEGQSMRATARLADVSFNTVAKLLIDAGKVAADRNHPAKAAGYIGLRFSAR